MSKAYYEVIGDKVFKLSSNALSSPIPMTSLVGHDGTRTQMTIDGTKVLGEIFIDPASDGELKSNKEMVDDILSIISTTGLKEIQTVSPNYYYMVDYSIYGSTEGEIQHSMSFGVFNQSFGICPLGVNEENHLCYKQVSILDQTMFLRSEQSVCKWGITENYSGSKYRVVINDISIYLDTNVYEDSDVQATISNFISGNKTCLKHGSSSTLLSMLQGMTKVWSSFENHLVITPIDTKIRPTSVQVKFNIMLDDIAVVYDDSTITSALNQ